MGTTSFGRIATTDRVTNANTATLAVTEADHEGQCITLNRAGGIAVTLPASTGGGAKYRFIVGTTFTSAGTIKVANANDTMCGSALLLQDAGDTVVGFAAGATADTITMDGSTTGGLKGAFVEVQDIAANLFHVNYVSDASGTEATPFSATV